MSEQNNQSRRHRSRRAGAFSLVELLLVMVILGVLAAIVVPKFTGRTQDAKLTQAAQDINSFKTALRMYETDNGAFPTDNEGLAALVAAAGSGRRSYLEVNNVPNDPWGRPYVYHSPSSRSNAGYEVYSLGPDGVESNDDIISWAQ